MYQHLISVLAPRFNAYNLSCTICTCVTCVGESFRTPARVRVVWTQQHLYSSSRWCLCMPVSQEYWFLWGQQNWNKLISEAIHSVRLPWRYAEVVFCNIRFHFPYFSTSSVGSNVTILLLFPDRPLMWQLTRMDNKTYCYKVCYKDGHGI